jgi:hypothetical protein
MIKTFDTSISAPATGSGTSAPTGGSGSTKKIITVVVILAVAYLGYKFVVKPMLDKKKEEAQ